MVEGFFDDKYNRQNKRVSERCSHIFTFDFCALITQNSFMLLLLNISVKGKKKMV
jgi:hypothetical protein